jgi:UDP-N-acetylglucosamine transferase subunit ALG13
MIFVTVGNDFRGFDRLVKEMDEIAPSLPCELVIQKGYSRYCPKNSKYFDFVSMDEAVEYMRRSQLVVSHAGIGTIILCRKYRIPILILPRRKALNEHMNDHQFEIARNLRKRGDPHVHVIDQEEELKDTILKVLAGKAENYPTEKTGREKLVRVIRDFVESG